MDDKEKMGCVVHIGSYCPTDGPDNHAVHGNGDPRQRSPREAMTNKPAREEWATEHERRQGRSAAPCSWVSQNLFWEPNVLGKRKGRRTSAKSS